MHTPTWEPAVCVIRYSPGRQTPATCQIIKAASDAFPSHTSFVSNLSSGGRWSGVEQIAQPRLNERSIGVRTHLQTVSTQQFINFSRVEGHLPCGTCMKFSTPSPAIDQRPFTSSLDDHHPQWKDAATDLRCANSKNTEFLARSFNGSESLHIECSAQR